MTEAQRYTLKMTSLVEGGLLFLLAGAVYAGNGFLTMVTIAAMLWCGWVARKDWKARGDYGTR